MSMKLDNHFYRENLPSKEEHIRSENMVLKDILRRSKMFTCPDSQYTAEERADFLEEVRQLRRAHTGG